MVTGQKHRNGRKRILLCSLLGLLWDTVAAQIRYSIPEEMEKGSFVGNIAKDLGLEPRELYERGARIVSRGKKQHFSLSLRSGSLVTADRIDREQLCAQSAQCLLNFNVLVEDKLKIYSVEVEITDINDNAPRFREEELELKISETTAPGTQFILESAYDPDVGVNSLQGYKLSPNNHFSLLVQSGVNRIKYPELVLERSLDREVEPTLHIVLSAWDGGEPVLSGTVRIRVTLLDANDNAPVFTQPVYTVNVPENVPQGTVLLTVNATDADEGSNSQVRYFLVKIPREISQIFQMNSVTGELSTLQNLDYEDVEFHEMDVEAQDGLGFWGRAKIHVTVLDMNDNAPEVTITSVTNSIPENVLPGAVIALLHVHDRDSGEYGRVLCSIPGDLPFKLEKKVDNYHSLVTARALDREEVPEYNITVRAEDFGSPALSTDTHILLRVADINDNPPTFSQVAYSAYIQENNPRGASIYSLTAQDPDSEQNALVTYSIMDSTLPSEAPPLSSIVSINSETGVLYALCSFNYEQFQEFQLTVTARDSGDPPLSTNVSLTLFILDQNDNAPEILYPAFPTDGSSGVELAPRSAEPGYLVTKVVAVDADSGQNAWLSYRLLKATELGLFSVGLHSGEIRTVRTFLDKDALKQNLIVAVTDNGEPPLSATVSVTVAVADSIPKMLSNLNSQVSPDPQDDSLLTFYLVIAVAVVSCLFFAFIVLLLALRLRRWWMLQVVQSAGDHVGGIPSSQFLGIDGVRAFLQTYSHEVSLTTDSRKSQLIFPQPNYADTLISQQSCEKKLPLLTPENVGINEDQSASFQQAPPNTDWRFSQAQRPGTSGSQNGDEGGTWPNNQFDTEMLQAMILASANEAADGSSTLGGGAGTMGLSARYGPQFTLQHVPDYRQNVYIPGSTATLANAAGKRDGKATAGGNGNKKKSGKKEKK
ncbi:protocadherin gamma-A3-like isoform X3 [Trichosurus vulpecula]|uniref:protocadherin gamma-A3-like isoform X3 n=1 Tax=Trichosurus vulpecula TaxID=9337 RepID=UPI00186AE4E3|nr:protocadherin gamma-A3-like isoform X3 [Trichosurus vulpecula]